MFALSSSFIDEYEFLPVDRILWFGNRAEYIEDKWSIEFYIDAVDQIRNVSNRV